MKFGIFVMAQHPMGDPLVERFQQAVEQTRLARDAGFDTIASGHHYLSPPYQSLQSIPLMSRLAADSGRGGLVCLNSAARFDKWNRAAVR